MRCLLFDAYGKADVTEARFLIHTFTSWAPLLSVSESRTTYRMGGVGGVRCVAAAVFLRCPLPPPILPDMQVCHLNCSI